jgi:anti-sigma factor RsiW
MRECVEEGILQAYVDDELSPEMMESVAAHIAACVACEEAATGIVSASALFASAFEAEMALEVPTVHLRERIDAAIAETNRPGRLFEQKQGARVSGWLASFAGLFKISPPRAFGFASLIAVIGLAAIFAIVSRNRTQTESNTPAVAVKDERPAKTTPPVAAKPSPTPTMEDDGNTAPGRENRNPPSKRKAPKKQSDPNLVPAPNELPRGELAGGPLPGEENYLKAIDSLTVEIESSGELAMKPSLRAEYERNLAIVDRAIDSTRRVARRNPNDQDASQFLYSSYQSKLDLLTTVAEQVRPTVATR